MEAVLGDLDPRPKMMGGCGSLVDLAYGYLRGVAEFEVTYPSLVKGKAIYLQAYGRCVDPV
jgi:hypothetical protein